MKASVLSVLVGAVVLIAAASNAPAAEIGLLAAVGMKAPLDELLPSFETESGHRVVAVFDAAAAVKKRVDAGEPFCVTVLAVSAMDDLVKRGIIDAASRAPLAHVGVGLAYRAGDPRPKVETMDDVKATLLATSSLSVSDPAAGGVSSAFFRDVVKQLGIEEAMAKKTVLTRPGEGAKPVAAHQTDLGIVTISEIASLSGIDAVPLFPGDPRTKATFAIGLSSRCAGSAAAGALIEALRSPRASAVFKSKRIEPD